MHIAAHIIFLLKKNGFNLWWFNPIYFWRKKKKDEGKLWIMWWMPGLGLYTIILFTTVNLDNFDVVFKSRICQITNAHSSHALNLDLLRLKFWGFHYIFEIQICNLYGVKKILKKKPILFTFWTYFDLTNEPSKKESSRFFSFWEFIEIRRKSFLQKKKYGREPSKQKMV